ncbi:hypothetical protein SOVF_176600, partial [Spinacia oleracea]
VVEAHLLQLIGTVWAVSSLASLNMIVNADTSNDWDRRGAIVCVSAWLVSG